MLVPSGSNKNHYPAEVNISSAPLQLANSPLLHPGSGAEDSNLWNIVGGITENGIVGAALGGILTTGVVGSTTTTTTSNGTLIGENHRPALTDSVNNNKRNNLVQSDNFRQNYNSFPPPLVSSSLGSTPSVISELPPVTRNVVPPEEEEEEESSREKEEEDGGDGEDEDEEVCGKSVILSEVDLVASVNISLNNSKKNYGEVMGGGGKDGGSHSPPLPPAPPTERMDSGEVGMGMQNINNKKMSGGGREEVSGEESGGNEREGRKGLSSVREEIIVGEEKVRVRGSGKTSAKSKALHKIMSASTRSMSTSGGDEHGEKMEMTTSGMSSSSYGMNSMRNNVNNNHVNLRHGPLSAPNTPETMRKHQIMLRRDLPLLSHSMYVPHTTSGSRREKYEFNQIMMRGVHDTNNRPLSYHGRSTETINASPSTLSTCSVNKRHVGSSSSVTRSRKEAILFNRRSMPSPYLENRFREKFDVSALDTNLPRIDLEAIENHLRIAREEERKRRSDREEIRRRLALESDDVSDKPNGRKPSLHSRLQSSMNLQICFMNETASDSESPNSDTEAKNQQPVSLPHVKPQSGNSYDSSSSTSGAPSEDFYAKQARLQAEARQALSQAKEMARLQMTQEKDRRLTSPITEMVKNSLLKVGVSLPPERRRVSRQLLTEMNVAQLQVIVNDLHTHIEVLNETLVSMLLERDDLHMEQDSMLVDIEDLTRYLAAKDNSPHQSLPLIAPSRSLLGKK